MKLDYGHGTMVKKPRYVPAGEFKARCLALLDEVAATGIPIIVTKRSKPVARVVPLEEEQPRGLLGSIVLEKDIVSALDERWDAEH